jgi:hypothetical protein
MLMSSTTPTNLTDSSVCWLLDLFNSAHNISLERYYPQSRRRHAGTMLTTTKRAIQGRPGGLLHIPKLAARRTQLSRPAFSQIRHGSAVPGKDPDNMGGPGGQETLLDSAALRRYVVPAFCAVFARHVC